MTTNNMPGLALIWISETIFLSSAWLSLDFGAHVFNILKSKRHPVIHHPVGQNASLSKKVKGQWHDLRYQEGH